jgi:hypothetical protein
MASGQHSSDVLGITEAHEDISVRLTRLYVRFVAMMLLMAGLLRACVIFGITLDGQNFLTLDMHWRAAILALVFVDLFAAVGLWIGATWGPVMWAVAVLVECAMYTILADRFGSYPWRVSVHLMLFGLFLILAGIDWHRARRG